MKNTTESEYTDNPVTNDEIAVQNHPIQKINFRPKISPNLPETKINVPTVNANEPMNQTCLVGSTDLNENNMIFIVASDMVMDP